MRLHNFLNRGCNITCMIVQMIAAVGLLLSLYALYVKYRAKDPAYHAACDLSDRVSCTKAFGSEYGSLFVLSNALWGVLFYVTVIVLASLGFAKLVFSAAVLAMLGTMYLAYISYVVQKNFCVVCTCIYIVNFLLLIAAV